MLDQADDTEVELRRGFQRGQVAAHPALKLPAGQVAMEVSPFEKRIHLQPAARPLQIGLKLLIPGHHFPDDASRDPERLHPEERDVKGEKQKFLVNQIVLTDPKVYTEPIKITATLQSRPDLNLLEYTCTDTLWEDYLSQRGLTLPDLDALPSAGR